MQETPQETRVGRGASGPLMCSDPPAPGRLLPFADLMPRSVFAPYASAMPIAVLDTNVVLDWLVFGNPQLAALRTAIEFGHCRWAATAAMREELASVLMRPRFEPWRTAAPRLWADWHRHCVELPTPAPGVPTSRLRCTDPDDQKFIDFAARCGARWLVSRDRAVLKLAPRLREFGVEVCTPETWTRHGKGATEAAPF